MITLDPSLKTVLEQVAQSWGLPCFTPVLLQNVEFCDQMLGLADQVPLPDDLRRDLYASYIGPGPGGLRAFKWLLAHQQLEPSLVRDYLACLRAGPSHPHGLDGEEAIELARLLLTGRWCCLGGWESLLGLARLLNSDALSYKARVSAFRWLLSPAGLEPTSQWKLAHWASRRGEAAEGVSPSGNTGREAPEGLPGPHPDLEKVAFLECVALGESPASVLMQARLHLEQESAALAVLDLVRHYAPELGSELVVETLLDLNQRAPASARRQAFPILEGLQGEDWIHRGLRDRDAMVRSWALQRLQKVQQRSA